MQPRSSWNRLLVLVACGVLPTRAMAQGATINGKVIGEAGAPLVGATISIGGMGIGTQTGADGAYSFTVPAARVTGQAVSLMARRVGYIPQAVPITLSAGTITHDFTMMTTPLQLEQVIVTGAGTSQVRERIGSTINTVDTDADHARVAAAERSLVAVGDDAERPRQHAVRRTRRVGVRAHSRRDVGDRHESAAHRRRQPADRQQHDLDERRRRQHRRAEPRGRHQSERRRVGADPQGLGGIGDLRCARGERRHSDHHEARRERADAVDDLVDADVRQRHQDVPAPAVVRSGQRTAPPGTCSTPDCNANSLSWGPRSRRGRATFDHGKEIYDTGITSDNAISLSGGNQRTTFYLSGGVTDQLGMMKGCEQSLRPLDGPSLGDASVAPTR